MAIPKIEKQNIIDALKYIDENGVPSYNQSVKYELVTEDGRRYPPKYVVAVADHLANGTEISTEGYNATEAKSFLESQNFTIETKQRERIVRDSLGDGYEVGCGFDSTGIDYQLYIDGKKELRELNMEANCGFEKAFPDIPVYLTYAEPYFRLRAGDFRNRVEAEKCLRRIKPLFREAFVTSDIIYQPKIQQKTEE